MEKRPFFRAAMARLGKYNMGGYGRIGVYRVNLSDHLAIWAARKKKFVKKEKINFKGRSYKHYNKEDFQQSLIEHNWDQLFQLEDPNEIWTYLYKAILGYIDPLCPIKSFKVYNARDPG